MEMAVRVDPGTPLSADIVARWQSDRPDDAVADAGDNRLSGTWARQPREPFPANADCWPAFAADLRALQGAYRHAEAQEPTFSECELVYVNPVTFEEQWPRHSRLERLLVRWLVPEPGDGWLSAPEGIVADATFPMRPGADGAPGRLCVRMNALSTETSEQLFGMTLSAHCIVDSADVTALEAAFDVAFDWVVRGYATLGDPVG